MKITVRRAELQDMDWLVTRFEKADKVYPIQIEIFSWEFVEQRLVDMMTNHVLLVAEQGEELIGYIGGYYAPHIFNPKISTLIQALWWVDEQRRGGRASYLLLKEFEKMGSVCDLIWLSFHRDTNIKDSSMERLGYAKTEKWYLKENV